MSGSLAPSTVTVALGDRSYPIRIGNGLLADLGTQLSEVVAGGQAFVISNPTVAAVYYPSAAESLSSAGFEPVLLEIPDGEQHKTLATLASIYDRVLERSGERSSPIVALGGGVVGDVAGFAAATLLRGVPYVQVPTTLLAQVDSSVGGKTAVNHAAGKNLIGSFYQPRLVVIDIDTLTTLPRRELVAGLAEVIKYGVIVDRELFDLVDSGMEDLLRLKGDLLAHVIRRCCEIKATVVSADERENNLRAILNFGHTVGHAIEAVTEYRRFLHGEAVAMGMVAAAKLSERLGFCRTGVAARIATVVERSGLRAGLPSPLDPHRLVAAITHDKKASGGKVKFVCIEEIGKTRFHSLSADEVIRLLAD